MGYTSVGILLRDMKTDELFTVSENSDKVEEEYEIGDEYRKSTIIRFPSSLGITGHVYNSG